MRSFLVLAFSATFITCMAQERATCLFSETFNGPGIPAGWQIGAQVEQQDPDGNGLGTFVDAWRVENASATNTGEVIHVPDVPAGNSFAIANDDAPPCNCNMQDVALTSPSIDLAGQTHAGVSFRAFNDGFFNASDGLLEASTDGNAWSTVLDIPEEADWQELVADLDAFAGGNVMLRFRWSDNGNWATGFAIDQVCVFAPAALDLTMMQGSLGDPTTSAFLEPVRSLGYTQIPLQQTTPLQLSMHVRNNGFDPLVNVHAHVTITINAMTAEFDTLIIPQLAAMQDTIVSWNTGWQATETGNVQVVIEATHDGADNDPSDDDATLNYQITSFAQGDPMAIDNDQPEVMVGGSTDVFALGCRYELITDGTVWGVGARLGTGTTPGTAVHFLLLDGQLTQLATSTEHTVTDADLALCFSGGLLYLPFEVPVDISEERDVFGLVRMDNGTLFLAAGGTTPQGSALKVNSDLTIDHLEQAPMIRLFFADPVTSVEEATPAPDGTLTLVPNPANGPVRIVTPQGTLERYQVVDPAGRTGAEGRGAMLDVSAWPTGVYAVRAWTSMGVALARLVVVR